MDACTVRINNLIKKFNEKSASNKTDIVITKDDFKNLSKFEIQSIKMLGKIYGVLSGDEENINLKSLMDIYEKWGAHKTDPEKMYLMALFFPEKVNKVYQINPFPTPAYTFKQTVSLRLSPNSNGNFALQVVCPYFYESSIASLNSNVYTTVDSALDGTAPITAVSNTLGTGWNPQKGTALGAGWFNAASLIAFKVQARYIGRSDAASGFFGGGYQISSLPINDVDPAGSNFDYINRSVNGTVSPLYDGISITYTVNITFNSLATRYLIY